MEEVTRIELPEGLHLAKNPLEQMGNLGVTSGMDFIRGPILVGLVLLSLIIPIVASWSSLFLVQLTLLSVGMTFFVADFVKLGEYQLRMGLRSLLDRVVVDDVLRAFHDPDVGMIPSMIGTFVGASTMYSLRMNDQQRTKLVQASLWTSEDQAREILLQPGGCKQLLPESVRTWLEKDSAAPLQDVEPEAREVMMEYVEGESHTTVTECEEPQDEDGSITFESANVSSPSTTQRSAVAQPPLVMDRSQAAKHAFEEARARVPQYIPTDPVMVLNGILREMFIEYIRPFAASLPASTIEMVGTAALAAVVAQVGLRRPCKRSLLRSAGPWVMSTIATGAFSTVFARQMILGNIHDMASFQLIGKAITMRIWYRLKATALQSSAMQSALALIVLGLVGRKRFA